MCFALVAPHVGEQATWIVLRRTITSQIDAYSGSGVCSRVSLFRGGAAASAVGGACSPLASSLLPSTYSSCV